MAELELGAALIPEPPGMIAMDLQARPAACPLTSGLRLGLPKHQKPGGCSSKFYGVCAPTKLMWLQD